MSKSPNIVILTTAVSITALPFATAAALVHLTYNREPAALADESLRLHSGLLEVS